MRTPRAEQRAQARARSVCLDDDDNNNNLDCLLPSSLPMASRENLMALLGVLPLQLEATSSVEENSKAVLQSLDAALRFLTSGDANTPPPISNAGAIADLIAKFADLAATDPWGLVTVEGGTTLYSVCLCMFASSTPTQEKDDPMNRANSGISTSQHAPLAPADNLGGGNPGLWWP
ncbi:hypothetical protein NP233_g12552 [Leucocoprinus birnbaumii]|uniref:Uncharacterized protein n=1 Tax=Leucocoprinus birnbaumii TaxID=56174 RepID=A0AAD5YPW6_9AGAR|nr:hypothetical protein NP233_g12552 [Leucocoprinus birnbaumii]